MKKLKKIAIVASGWHFPASFYRNMAKQKLPNGWTADSFCISHRDPKFAIEEKKNDSFDESLRGRLDRKLYSEMATKDLIETLGWKYKEYPNTVGDWGNTNQWLEENNYKDYDLFLFTHDDNLLLNDSLFVDIIKDKSFKKWGILCNSLGMPQGTVRGSFEFFKPDVIEKMGGKFDLSEVSLDRTGETGATNEIEQLYDWNNMTYPLMRFIDEQKIPIGFLSPAYRVSAYCIEGERGYISKTHGANTEHETKGFDFLFNAGII